ncbi:50S ribosomal protein L29 [Candidatus Woesearchaeota archaeon]|nr:50S ribosomal protein L29 [Candidatus Woesearchaeota archaeon]
MKPVNDLRALSDEALRSKVADLRKELMKFNTQVAVGTVPKSPGLSRSIKRSIARALTILNERKVKTEV